MRRLQAGLVTLFVLTFALAARGQFKAEVETVGFQNYYRPDCWTPMVLRITPNGAPTGQYQIRVKQKDADGDEIVFTKDISITGGENAQAQRFWMYFAPQPAGLPDANGASNLRDLQKQLRVFLLTKSGKEIMTVPVSTTITSVDPKPGSMDYRIGPRLILAVSDGRSQIITQEFEKSLGLLERPIFIRVRPDQLPENPLGYDAIDGVVWLNVDPAELSRRGPEQLNALRSYVRTGGHLVISHPAEWQKTLGFGDLLPVDPTGVRSRPDAEPLHSLADIPGIESVDPKVVDPWPRLKGPFTIVLAQPQPNTIVDQWVTWNKEGTDRTPYIARKSFGCGAVTWVAQDLGDPAITSVATLGWVNIWDKIFDWKNDPLIVNDRTKDDQKKAVAPAPTVDLGTSYLDDMNFDRRVGLFIGLAVLFFVGYWLIAGPGLYFALSVRKQTRLSWFLFGASAIAATILTVLIVKVVLRGPPEIHHFTLLRQSPGEPTIANMRFGLYIPKDGDQTIELKDSIPEQVSAITAYPSHPAHITEEAVSLASLSYNVPVRETASEDTPAVTVPYRSSLKKFSARWIGDLPQAISGTATVTDDETEIAGSLTNNTQHDLHNVYFAIKFHPRDVDMPTDWLFYLPKWAAGEKIDLNKTLRGEAGKRTPYLNMESQPRTVPDAFIPLRGRIGSGVEWMLYWSAEMRRLGNKMQLDDALVNDIHDAVPRSFPMLSLFQRLPVMKNALTQQTNDRVDLLRRGVRKWDLSPAMAGGGLVVLAQGDNERSPVPIEVDGNKVIGEGRVFYQFVLPVDRSRENGLQKQPTGN